jgi:predicted Rossmann fold flavoprotein
MRVLVLEKTAKFLSKVRISGGGRCNVTHACFDPADFATRYPRGGQALIGPFTRFQASDTVAWFESRGVKLKTESDGRVFPVTDSSQTIIDCLLNEAREAGVQLRSRQGVDNITARPAGDFELKLSTGESLECDRLLLAMGGTRATAVEELCRSLGHTLEPPVPSLFTFHLELSWLRALAGISVEAVRASVPGTDLDELGPLLITHTGLSGPVILRLSAWGARVLHGMEYRFPVRLNWLPHLTDKAVRDELDARRRREPNRKIVNSPFAPLPSRLWESLVLAAGIQPDTRWSALSRSAAHKLSQQLTFTELPVTGKSLNKEEFVTCGGVRLAEVDFKTMGSRVRSGLFFAGELLDIDGITGGFNFQAAWTTGYLAGQAMAR